MAWVALLSGEHPTLPAAELRALLDVHAPAARLEASGRIARIDGKPHQVLAALRRAALLHEAGLLVADEPDDLQGLERAAHALREHARGLDDATTAAVATTRHGLARGVRSAEVERSLGGALRDAGHAIDLQAPATTFTAWLGEGRIVVARRDVDGQRSSYQARVAAERDHFSPVSLHPRRAAALLHLARPPPGGLVYDPFCGTGAFVLEAALEGHHAMGSDLDAWMVQGTWQALTDDGPEPLDGTVFEADIGAVPDLVGPVDAIVTDLPYGRASSSHDEALAALYDRALWAFARLLPAGRLAVVGHSDPEALGDPARHGFEVLERHSDRAHRSLTRHFLVLRRSA